MQHGDQQLLQKLDGQNPVSIVQYYTRLLCDHMYLKRPKYKSCNESQSDEVNGVGSIPVWSGVMDFEEIGQKQNRSF